MANNILKEDLTLYDIPDNFKILKHDLFDYVFTRGQSDFYFSLLFNIEYIPKQRIKEELFRKGALIKVTSEKDAKPTFYPTPPNFIFFIEGFNDQVMKKHKHTISMLEDIYFERFCNSKDSFLKHKLIFLTGKGPFIIGLMLFLIKKYMKESSQLILMDFDHEAYERMELAIGTELLKRITLLIPDHNEIKKMTGFKKLKTIDRKYLSRERMTIIDDIFLMHYFSLQGRHNERLLSGYLTSIPENIKETKEKFNALFSIN